MKLSKKIIISLLGLIVMAFGVAFSIKGNLGTSPLSTVPYTISQLTPLTVGTATIAMHCVFVLAQILMLGKRYEWFQLTQLVVAVIFGTVTDLATACLGSIGPSNYFEQWIYCIIGIILVGLAVSLEVAAKFVLIAGEGTVVAICEVVPIKFGNMKMIFDIFLVIVAVSLGLIFRGQLFGVREGTIASALLVGQTSKVFTKLLAKLGVIE